MSVFLRDSVGLQAVLGVRGDRKTTAHNSVPGQRSCPAKYEPQVGNRGCVGFFFFFSEVIHQFSSPVLKVLSDRVVLKPF